jgi:hypothetical protein
MTPLGRLFRPSATIATIESAYTPASASADASAPEKPPPYDTRRFGDASREAEEKDSSSEGEMKGGKLSATNFKSLLDASYDAKITKVGDFELDKQLSTKNSKVYINKITGQAVVAHKGTEGLLDWGNNMIYALGGKDAYKKTSRFKQAEKVQNKAEEKYGAKNVSTIGHSQGGLQAELLGGKSREILTLNKATRPFEKNENKNQYDVRSKGDVVSALNPFEEKSEKKVEIDSQSYNPLTEHSGDVLDRLDKNLMLGEGIKGGIHLKGHSRICGGRLKRTADYAFGDEEPDDDPALVNEDEGEDDEDEDDEDEEAQFRDVVETIIEMSQETIDLLNQELLDIHNGVVDYGNELETFATIANISEKRLAFVDIYAELIGILNANPSLITAGNIRAYLNDYVRSPIQPLVSPTEWEGGLLLE